MALSKKLGKTEQHLLDQLIDRKVPIVVHGSRSYKAGTKLAERGLITFKFSVMTLIEK